VVKVITRHWTVTDALRHSASQDQTITVTDNTAPTLLNFPTNTSVECPGDTSTTPTALRLARILAAVAQSLIPTARPPALAWVIVVKDDHRTLDGDDACGNSAARIRLSP